MNWFKISQQGLLFYPWKKSIDETSAYPKPSFIDKNGIRYYRCSVCENDVPEDDIADFIDQAGYYKDQTEQFSYPFRYIDWKNPEKLSSELNRLYLAVKPIWDEHIRLNEEMSKFQYNTKDNTQKYISLQEKDYNLDKSNIIKVFNSSNELRELAEMIDNVAETYNYRFLVYLSGESTYDFDNYSYFMNNPVEFISSLLDIVTKYGKSFDVASKKAVCNKCQESAKRCVSCNEPIIDEKDSFPVTWDNEDRVCRDCVDNGNFDVCSECGEADSHDEMHYLEWAEETYCDKCIKNKRRDYSEIEHRIEEISRNNPRPFKEWFKDGDRIYIPFSTKYMKMGDEDKKIIKYLEQNGCDVDAISYQDGYCEYKGRKFKIGKFLEKIKYDNVKKIQEKFKNNPGLRRAFENKINVLFRDLLSNFSNSNYREYRNLQNDSNKMIVISQNPHDIAKMSTGRNWSSCMNLDQTREREDEVFCEVEEGGLIAYLVSKDDMEIENPHSRLLIRRFENENGVSLAIPETVVYGEASKSFYYQVKDWLEERQGHLPKGNYEIQGMEYVQSLENIYTRASMMIANQIIKIQNEINKMKKLNWYKANVKIAYKKDRLRSVPLKGKLMQTEKGFVYLKVSNDVIHGMFRLIDDDSVEEPPYFGDKPSQIGAHISVIADDEIEENKIEEIVELGKEFNFKLGKMYQTKPEGWDELDKVFFIAVDSPELVKLRKKYGLQKSYKGKGHEFHITVGVVKAKKK